MKALITGISGLAGSYLAELLVDKKYEIFGIDTNINGDNIKNVIKKIKIEKCDIKKRKTVEKIIKKIKPDLIFHLAGIVYELTDNHALENMYQTNVVGMINVFEAIKNSGINPVVLVTCSSAEYGVVFPDENPIKEVNVFRPITPYGITKVAQDMVAFKYQEKYNMKIIRTRTFNNTAPRENPFFVCSNFAKQIAEIEKGHKHPILNVGNTRSVRDFTDTRDVVNAYYLCVEKGSAGEVYNVCSGIGYSIRNILDMLLKMSNTKISVKEQKNRIREYDVPVQIGDYSKLKKDAGWKPVIDMKKTLKDILNYWREKV